MAALFPVVTSLRGIASMGAWGTRSWVTLLAMSVKSAFFGAVAVLSVVGLMAIAVRADQAPAKSGLQPSAAARKVTAPPLPQMGYAPGRPIDIARAVYDFAAQHPEVLKYVPCYCGCENEGHGDNESCFVKRRDAKGNVLAWDMHGYG